MSELGFLDKDTRIKDSALQEVHSFGEGPDTKMNGQEKVAACCVTSVMIQAAGAVQMLGYSWYPRGRQELNLIFGAETRPTLIRETVNSPL
jgi:hypothetical protein